MAAVTASAPASRDEAAQTVLDVLATACPAAEVGLMGSMATAEQADVFSDIDVCWTVPPAQAAGQLLTLRLTLGRIGTVESLRVDPAERRDGRLVFVRFRGWPLWWRVDLEIHAEGSESMDVGDADPWSPYESACMGVIVALKALARHRPEAAEALFARAVRRADAEDVGGDWQPRLDSLLDQIETRSPLTADLVSRTRHLSRQVFTT